MTRKRLILLPKSTKDPNLYPTGWNYDRVQRVIKYYDRLKNKPVLKQRISKDIL